MERNTPIRSIGKHSPRLELYKNRAVTVVVVVVIVSVVVVVVVVIVVVTSNTGTIHRNTTQRKPQL